MDPQDEGLRWIKDPVAAESANLQAIYDEIQQYNTPNGGNIQVPIVPRQSGKLNAARAFTSSNSNRISSYQYNLPNVNQGPVVQPGMRAQPFRKRFMSIEELVDYYPEWEVEERYFERSVMITDRANGDTALVTLERLPALTEAHIKDLFLESRRIRKEPEPTMLEKLIKLYYAYMAMDVRSPIPHLAGPPGTNKSGVIHQLGDLLRVRVHTLNVSRISPLELEGIQMPVGNVKDLDEYRLHLLVSTVWKNLNEGDIVFLDEFMRGFPEVYNGLLDIMTSREVAGFQLPRVFFVAASNSVAAYDKALEDRLLHLYVPDIRKNRKARDDLADLFIRELGLDPRIGKTDELKDMFKTEVEPMYEVLDQFKNNKPGIGTTATKGRSIRNLIGQAKLREVSSKPLQEVIQLNNQLAMSSDKAQFVLLLSGKNVHPGYVRAAERLKGNPRLTPVQAANLDFNLQLIEMEAASTETDKEVEDEDDDDLV